MCRVCTAPEDKIVVRGFVLEGDTVRARFHCHEYRGVTAGSRAEENAAGDWGRSRGCKSPQGDCFQWEKTEKVVVSAGSQLLW